MKKKAVIFTVVTVIAGAIGAFLRRRELATVFRPDGLAERGAAVSIILMVLCVIFAAAVIVFIAVKSAGLTADGSYNDIFHVNSPVILVISAVLGVSMIAAGYLNYRSAAVGGTRAVVEGAVGILAALAGISGFSLSFNASRRRGGSALPSLLVTVFICFFILVTYKKRAEDPVLLDYMYDFLALCLSAVGTYCIAGFAFGRPAPRKTAAFSYIAAFFCIIAAADALGDWTSVFYAFLAAYQLIHAFLLTAALAKPAPEESGCEADSEADD